LVDFANQGLAQIARRVFSRQYGWPPRATAVLQHSPAALSSYITTSCERRKAAGRYPLYAAPSVHSHSSGPQAG